MLATAQTRDRTTSAASAQEGKVAEHESAPPKKSNGVVSTTTIAIGDATEETAAPNNTTATATAPTPRRRPSALWKSPRLKGYLTLMLASIIHYNAAYHSNDALFNNAIAATPTQQRYAMAASLVSAIVSAFAILAHLDRYSPLQKLWRTIFKPKSRFELALLLLILVWWSLATGIQTAIRGISGDGKGQYNLYFSSWVCALSSIWMVERWWVSYGWSSFTTFLSSWPHRAPGWMAMTFMSFFTLIWYIDLYKNWRDAPEKNGVLLLYQKVSRAQWQWLLFITGFTILPGLTFVLIELFRETASDESSNNNSNNNSNNKNATTNGNIHHTNATSNTTNNTNSNLDNNNNNNNHDADNRGIHFIRSSSSRDRGTTDPADTPGRRVRRRLSESVEVVRPIITRTISNDGKGPTENIIEGVCLLVLMAAWIPTVVLATSPGGIASLVGNSYFFTWATSIFVTETTVWWIHDWRKNIHSVLEQQARDYQNKQLQVLKKSHQIQQRAAMVAARSAAGPSNSDDDDDDDDDYYETDDDNDDEQQKQQKQQNAEEQKEEEGQHSSPLRKKTPSFGERQGSEFFDALEEITDGI